MTKPVWGAVIIALLAAIAIFYFTSAPSGTPSGEPDVAEGTTAEPVESADAGTLPDADRPARPTEVVSSTALPEDFNPELPRHGSSLFGELKYGPDFTHFAYVNPAAPKGGEVRYGAFGSFDNLNGFIVKGQAAAGTGFIYDTLMATSLDEPASEYGLVAASVRHPADYSSVTYTLRPEATWHDGKEITPDDVIWTLETLKKSHPFYNAYYANVVKAEKTGPHEVTFSFNETGNRELPLIVGQLPVLPQHYWEGENAKGEKRNFTETTLEPPLGSGPYRIAAVSPGRSITYERVEDYWGATLPVNVGSHNFDRIRFEYYRDTTVSLEALKADRLDFRMENSASSWATAYDIPAVRRGDLIREEVPSANAAGMQGFAFNLRREKFQDPRVREAFNWAFDFEWMNRNLFHEQYTRTGSYFANSELASSGLPEGLERAILEELKDELSPEIFTKTYEMPVTDGSGNNRSNLRRAADLLDAAGWKVENGKRRNGNGEVLNVEFLIDSPTFERVIAPYQQSLNRLGITSSIRNVDAAQYQRRTDTRNFDIIIQTFPQSLSPGNEQREFWGCEAATAEGSRNVIGICDPAIEKLIDRVIYAKDREALVAATRALDRVLLAGHYVVPQWHLTYNRVAYWARLKHPENMPPYSIGFPTIWWMASDAPPPAPADEASEAE